MELSTGWQELIIETAKTFKGYARRIFQAQVVNELGRGGQRQAEAELGWNRETIRKGQAELAGEFCHVDQFSQRGRLPIEARLPHLLTDIQAIAEGVSQTDPTFQTTRLYVRLSAAEVRRQLVVQKGYDEAELPSVETIRVKLNQLGYSLKKVKKSQPLKKVADTEAIFEQLVEVNRTADEQDSILRLSVDTKAAELLGPLSRGGYSRVTIKALDHDYRPQAKTTPLGIFLPQYNEVYIFLTSSPVTSDLIVDCIAEVWLAQKERFPQVKTLVINQDNGPECHSRRTQFMKRIVELADETQLTIQFAYYPPYHSKYNPIERVWGVLEQYWNGSLLDTLDTVVHFARNMSYKGVHPLVTIVTKTYHTGVKLTQKAMTQLEKRLERLPALEKYFVRISPLPT